MTDAPDYCQPITGWRLWSVALGNGRARLTGPIYPTVWQPGRELQAACDARRREPLRPWRVRPAEHAAPSLRCSCGVHAMTRPGLLSAYVPAVATRRSVIWVVGRVTLWGQVVEGMRGWRASRAYPAEVWLPEVHLNRKHVSRPEQVALELGDYGIPVRVCNGVTVRELIDDLARRLDPWRHPGARAA